MNSTSLNPKCPKCDRILSPGVPIDSCPACLLSLGLSLWQLDQSASAKPRIAIQPGSRLGHYEIGKMIGQGGTGTVYAARDLENSRHVALKVLSRRLESPTARRQFLLEGTRAGALNHPNLVFIFETEEFDDILVIATELMPGGDLEKHIATNGPLPLQNAVDAILDVLAGLRAMHAADLVHSDVKPSNCFIDAGGKVKLGDFGFAKLASSTQPEANAWTPAFAPPEQLRGENLTAASDIYSLAVTLLFLLTGRTSFVADDQIQPKGATPNEIPKALGRRILQCLDKNPARRPNIATLRDALLPFSSAAVQPAPPMRRSLAGFVDHCILSIISGIGVLGIWLLLMGVEGDRVLDASFRMGGYYITSALVTVTLCATYFAVFESRHGASPGKLLLGLRVIHPNRGYPTMTRAMVRAIIYLILIVGPAMLGIWLGSASPALLFVLHLSFYLMMGLLFCSARPTNGFAAIHDLLTGLRVVYRHWVPAPRFISTATDVKVSTATERIGPYSILETRTVTEFGSIIVGYDPKLQRNVWIRKHLIGYPETSAVFQNIARPGRLRWLNGMRSADEAWDAYEALSGEPLSNYHGVPQTWSVVRDWVLDVAKEMQAATCDGSMPKVLNLHQVWITAEGRSKFLDFLSSSAASSNLPPALPSQFLWRIAVGALTGKLDDSQSNEESRLPDSLPLHARRFLDSAARGASIDSLIEELNPIVHRITTVSTSTRAAVVGSCCVVPLMGLLAFLLLDRWAKTDPRYANYSALTLCLCNLGHLDIWRYDGGFNDEGAAFPALALESLGALDGIPFVLGTPNTNNVLRCEGQVIPFPEENGIGLKIIASAIRDAQPNQNLKVSYKDGSTSNFVQGISHWLEPQNFPGEVTVLHATNYADGEGFNDEADLYLYGYTLRFDPAKGAQAITLPVNDKVNILAMTLLPSRTPLDLRPAFNRSNGFVTEGYAYAEAHRLRKAIATYARGHFDEMLNPTSLSIPLALSRWRDAAFFPRRFELEEEIGDLDAPNEAELNEAAHVVESLIPELSNSHRGTTSQRPLQGSPYLQRLALRSDQCPLLANPFFFSGVVAGQFAVMISLFAMLAALLSGRGFILKSFGLVVVNKDGTLASRTRILWRTVIVWSPMWLLFAVWLVLTVAYCIPVGPSIPQAWTVPITIAIWTLIVLGTLFASILPSRSWPDRIAKTRLVPE